MGKLLALLLLVCVFPSHAQNLVANGNFDDRNNCLEYHTFCAPEAWFRVPLAPVTANRGTAGFLAGNRYESVVMENITHPMIFRSFIYTRILCKLEPGKVYRFKSSFRADELGFDHMDVILLPFEPYRNRLQLAVAKEKFTITKQQQTQTLPGNWRSYLFEFTATGKEQYLVIGNFSKEALPVKEQRYVPNVIYDVDNIALERVDAGYHSCPEFEPTKTKLYQNNNRHTPFNYLDDEPEVDITEEAAPVKDTPVLAETVAPPVPVANDTLVIPDVLFKFDKSELNPAFAYRLDTLINKIRNRSFKRIEILGHTDSFGKDEYNQQLSTNRAITVKKYLMDHLHYADDMIMTKGFAATIPVSTNQTAAGRQKNRRVEIVLIR